MSVDTTHSDAYRALVKVGGDLDISTVAPLCAVLDGHLAAGRRFLRLDLSEVTFLDAAALGGITRVHHEALQSRGTLVITGARPPVTRMLRLTRLDEVLFVGGPRGDDDLGSGVPISDGVVDSSPTMWPARPVPSMPPTIARSTRQAPPDRPGASRPASG
jgi:anti-anti-sigma factor